MDNLKRLVDQHLTQDLPLLPGAVKRLPCEVCPQAKMVRPPFVPSPSLASAPLQLLHMDLAGPFPTPSVGGHRYFLLCKMTTVGMASSTCMYQNQKLHLP